MENEEEIKIGIRNPGQNPGQSRLFSKIRGIMFFLVME